MASQNTKYQTLLITTKKSKRFSKTCGVSSGMFFHLALTVVFVLILFFVHHFKTELQCLQFDIRVLISPTNEVNGLIHTWLTVINHIGLKILFQQRLGMCILTQAIKIFQKCFTCTSIYLPLSSTVKSVVTRGGTSPLEPVSKTPSLLLLSSSTT